LHNTIKKIKNTDSLSEKTYLSYILINQCRAFDSKFTEQEREYIHKECREIISKFEKDIDIAFDIRYELIATTKSSSFIHKYTKNEVIPEDALFDAERRLENNGFKSILHINNDVMNTPVFKTTIAIGGAFGLEV